MRLIIFFNKIEPTWTYVGRNFNRFANLGCSEKTQKGAHFKCTCSKIWKNPVTLLISNHFEILRKLKSSQKTRVAFAKVHSTSWEANASTWCQNVHAKCNFYPGENCVEHYVFLRNYHILGSIRTAWLSIWHWPCVDFIMILACRKRRATSA